MKVYSIYFNFENLTEIEKYQTLKEFTQISKQINSHMYLPISSDDRIICLSGFSRRKLNKMIAIFNNHFSNLNMQIKEFHGTGAVTISCKHT